MGSLQHLPQSKAFNSALAIVVGALVVVTGYIAVNSRAATGPALPTASLTPPPSALAAPNPIPPVKLYLQPSATGSTLTVPIRLSAGNVLINAVEADVSYPADKLEYVSTDGTGSAFTVAAQATGGNGSVRIARGQIGSVSGDVLVATLRFKVKAQPATVHLAIDATSAALRSSDNQNALTDRAGADYALDGSSH